MRFRADDDGNGRRAEKSVSFCVPAGLFEDAVTRGLLIVTERKSLSLHPLLRELLVRRFDEADAEGREALLAHARRLFEARRWDEALCVAEASHDARSGS